MTSSTSVHLGCSLYLGSPTLWLTGGCPRTLRGKLQRSSQKRMSYVLMHVMSSTLTLMSWPIPCRWSRALNRYLCAGCQLCARLSVSGPPFAERFWCTCLSALFCIPELLVADAVREMHMLMARCPSLHCHAGSGCVVPGLHLGGHHPPFGWWLYRWLQVRLLHTFRLRAKLVSYIPRAHAICLAMLQHVSKHVSSCL